MRNVVILRLSAFCATVFLLLAGILLSMMYSAPLISISYKDTINPDVFWSTRIIGLGILTLSFIPLLRVVILMWIWVKENDWTNAISALLVFITLIFSMFSGYFH